ADVAAIDTAAGGKAGRPAAPAEAPAERRTGNPAGDAATIPAADAAPRHHVAAMQPADEPAATTAAHAAGSSNAPVVAAIAPVAPAVAIDAPTASDVAEATLARPATVSGTAEAGAAVEVLLNGERLGVATADGDGAWRFETTLHIRSGVDCALTARTADGAGGFSSSDAYPLGTLVIDPTPPPPVVGPVMAEAPAAEAPVAIAAAEENAAPAVAAKEPVAVAEPPVPAAGRRPTITGISPDTGTAGDHITGDRHLVLSGTARPGALVEVSVDKKVLGTVKADAATGAFTFDAGDN